VLLGPRVGRCSYRPGGDGLEKMPLHTTARFWLRLARGPLAAASAYATCSFTSCAAWPPTAPIQAKNTSVPDKSWRPGWQLALEYRIELGRELGSGGFGQVFLAINTKTGISRAVKRVRRDNLESDKALLREFEVMQRLQHCPHIVRVIDGFVDDTYRYMVMELCFGLDLVDSIMEELVNDDPAQEAAMLVVHPNIPHVSAVFREMLTALVECHANGVGHMDIKPENFIHMSTESRRPSRRATATPKAAVKLMDFGLAWADVSDKGISLHAGTQLGCSKYLAPELFHNGTSVAPEKCDMYALGVSLFNLLTGRFPYNFGRIGRPRSKADLSHVSDPDARDLIEKLLSADPAARLTAEEALLHPFILKYSSHEVEQLSEFTERHIQAFFTKDSPAKIAGHSCACAVAAHCPHRAVAKTVRGGEVLFHEGEQSRAVYFVTSGAFAVKKAGQRIATLGPQAVLGEMGALFERPRHATVVALEDSEVFEFKDFGEKLGSTQQRYALKVLQERALKDELTMTTREFLKSSTLFRDASEELLSTIIVGSDHAFFQAGELVVDREDDQMALYIVQEGLLEVNCERSTYQALVGPGEMIGEMALVFGERPGWHENIRAVKPTTALVLERSKFALILSNFPKEREIILKMAEWRVQEMGVGKGLLIARQ